MVKIHFQKVILFLILYKNYSESSDNAEMYKKNKIHEIQKIKKNESI